MSTTNALRNSLLRLGLVAFAAFLASCGGGGDGAVAPPPAVRYFSAASNGVNDFELWKTDGTEAGAVRVKDINPGAGGSSPLGFTVFNNAVYFSAFDGTSGIELWKTDGTEAGTVRVKDINPGAGSSGPFVFTIFNNAVYFSAFDGTSERRHRGRHRAGQRHQSRGERQHSRRPHRLQQCALLLRQRRVKRV